MTEGQRAKERVARPIWSSNSFMIESAGRQRGRKGKAVLAKRRYGVMKEKREMATRESKELEGLGKKRTEDEEKVASSRDGDKGSATAQSLLRMHRSYFDGRSRCHPDNRGAIGRRRPTRKGLSQRARPARLLPKERRGRESYGYRANQRYRGREAPNTRETLLSRLK